MKKNRKWITAGIKLDTLYRTVFCKSGHYLFWQLLEILDQCSITCSVTIPKGGLPFDTCVDYHNADTRTISQHHTIKHSGSFSLSNPFLLITHSLRDSHINVHLFVHIKEIYFMFTGLDKCVKNI